jgi:hypothetical protein
MAWASSPDMDFEGSTASIYSCILVRNVTDSVESYDPQLFGVDIWLSVHLLAYFDHTEEHQTARTICPCLGLRSMFPL